MKNNNNRGGSARSGGSGGKRGSAAGSYGKGGSSRGRGASRPTAAAAEIEGLPVAKNDEVTLDIIGMNHSGEGVGRADGYTLFVAGALPGEKISAKVLMTKKQYGYAKMQKLLQRSPARVEAPCEIFDRCGGCQIQHMDYAAQLEWKRQQVADSLQRIGKLNVQSFVAQSANGTSDEDENLEGSTRVSGDTARAGAHAAGLGEASRQGDAAYEVSPAADPAASTQSEAAEYALEASTDQPRQTLEAEAFGGGEGHEDSGQPGEESRTGNAAAEQTPEAAGTAGYDENAAVSSGGQAAAGEGILVPPTLGMSEPWRYRNKAQVPMGEESGRLIGGFYARGSHRIVDMQTCIIQHEANDEMVEAVKAIGRELGISAYDEETGRGLLRHVVVKVAFATGEKMVVLVTNSDRLPKAEQWIEAIRERVPGVRSICHNVNTRQTNVIFGDKTTVLWGEEVIHDYIGDVKFAISARSFYQVNPAQTEVLYGKTLEYAGLTGSETVIDAYCGIGTISLFLAQKAKRVYGVEIVKEAIEDARKNAEINGITNAEFEVGASEDVIPRWRELGITPDVIVVDPPRKGCDARLLETIIEMKPERVVYVSCNPATLARDLRVLEDGGFKTVKVQPVDMFPQTVHVEAVALLERLVELPTD
ncbi:23S rRNA (uracil(1939)-C(5))-methyltransferase RlmD [Saccharibacillus alkalitolerans]|uniref:23S rRNA (Uracil(1939)-C(5))-methyltransferase RlmD n=1 Tax=Saccharibacillus alkalitolerans TaxID=2705290 RepID=A0ABX0F2W0_9BACL|nr:23S rRNA (uracil(1939)-C(5))-methyltransferase RlmD [Saccharibacillus alkalitolerans]NGZ75321.1 23S rRNA (uracil(1939)-C(5))-methyltransferase RlmD [Saccharibacillus alkalitolerans]